LASFLEITRQVLDILPLEQVVAVGEKAAAALTVTGAEFVTVHHTAHDTRGEFASGMRSLFGPLR
jgi:hypothetical protein